MTSQPKAKGRPLIIPLAEVLERREKVAAMAKDGASVREIMDTLGLSDNTVRNDLRRLGIRPRIVKKVQDEMKPRQERVAQLLMDGVVTEEIAKRLGIHKNTARRDAIAALGRNWRVKLLAEQAQARRNRAADYYRAGMSAPEIAALEGVTIATVMKYLAPLADSDPILRAHTPRRSFSGGARPSRDSRSE